MKKIIDLEEKKKVKQKEKKYNTSLEKDNFEISKIPHNVGDIKDKDGKDLELLFD